LDPLQIPITCSVTDFHAKIALAESGDATNQRDEQNGSDAKNMRMEETAKGFIYAYDFPQFPKYYHNLASAGLLLWHSEHQHNDGKGHPIC
jgi:hypothetical protein